MKTHILLFMLMLPLFATAQQATELAIAGKSTTDVTPDITIVNITITATETNYSKAMDILQDKAHKTKIFLRKKGIDKDHISSENFSINKSYSYENRKQVFKGYNATLQIKLEFQNDLELANKILNALGESASDADVNVWHKISPELQQQVNDKLIKAAIADARHKAEIIAASTDQKIVQISKINYGVKENQMASPRVEANYLALGKSSDSGNNMLKLIPEPIASSTEIIIYWLMSQQ